MTVGGMGFIPERLLMMMMMMIIVTVAGTIRVRYPMYIMMVMYVNT